MTECLFTIAPCASWSSDFLALNDGSVCVYNLHVPRSRPFIGISVAVSDLSIPCIAFAAFVHHGGYVQHQRVALAIRPRIHVRFIERSSDLRGITVDTASPQNICIAILGFGEDQVRLQMDCAVS